MASYTVTTNAQQEAALTWVLAQMQAADPQDAPADKAALVTSLVTDRLQSLRRQHQFATATPASLKTLLDTADSEQLARVKTALGL